jgi:serine/threonine-protein kinase RsbT
MRVVEEKTLAVKCEADIVAVRQDGRAIAAKLGFPPIELTMITTAISELARNILQYAKVGEIVLGVERNGESAGIVITARDTGPGIRDVRQALERGFSTSGGLGLGLPGVRNLMDEMRIDSVLGKGTVVITRKWRH